MTNYLRYIFGIPTIVVGIYIFLLSFGIYKPKTAENKQSIIEKNAIVFKIISIVMILRGGYNLLNPDSNRYKINQNENVNSVDWTPKSRQILIDACL